MNAWKSDAELFELIKTQLYTPVVGDILDQYGCFHQFLPPAVRPLRNDMKIAGRAMPVLQMDVFGPQKNMFGLMTQALDDLKPGEVYIATGGTMQSANWGEIMTAAARTRGAVGAVVNGYHRDTPRVLEQNWPVFSRGHWAQDSAPRMKVVDFRCRIEIEGTVVEPGDLVFGDIDGVVIVPARLEHEVMTKALEKARAEKTVRKEIEGGMSSTAAFKKHGVL
ncbi:MAG TPA: RraA family protein [Opitutaceae bacterium]|jgi:regulator of RNase E activity RraA|nr:RraA family protein [Opitutaceae bacterium]